MHILHVTRDFPPPCRGGISTAVAGMVGASMAAGLRCSVLSLDDYRPSRELPANQAFDAVDLPCTLLRVRARSGLDAALQRAAQLDADLVHVHHGMLWDIGAELARARNLPAIKTVHVLQQAALQLRQTRSARALPTRNASLDAQLRALGQADLVLAPSRASVDWLANAHPGLTDRLVLTPLGIEDSTTAREAAARAHRPDAGPIVFLGRFSDVKGCQDWWQALAALARSHPGARFVVAGGLPDNPRAERRWLGGLRDALPADVGARLQTPGWLDPDARAALLSEAGLLVSPSWTETFGLGVLEAMLYGVPVLSTRSGGPESLIQSGHNGLLCETHDPAALTQCVQDMLRAPEWAAALGRQAARDARARWSWQAQLPELLKAYQQALVPREGGLSRATGTRRPACVTHTRLELDPIGVVRSPFTERMEAPRQPRVASEVRATVELFPGHNYEDALSDLALWDHIWLVVWFHANQGWKPRVLPPRSTTKRGVFATRAPRRPNPIGLSAVRLLSVTHLSLEIQGVDLLDGTPVLDIKPYVPWADAIPEASSGWLAPLEATGASTPADPAPDFELRFEPRAAEQLAYLQKDHEVALEAPIRQVLKLGPQPHAYRRIRREGDDYRLAIKDWRIHFSAEGRRIIVREIRSGYRTSEHSNAPGPHRDFISRYHQA